MGQGLGMFIGGGAGTLSLPQANALARESSKQQALRRNWPANQLTGGIAC